MTFLEENDWILLFKKIYLLKEAKLLAPLSNLITKSIIT